MQAHAAFCRRLMDDFCGEITGRNVDCLVGVHPQDRFLVGMLSPYEEALETSTNSSSVIVSQIGIDFFLEESDIRTATLQILPAGDLFYRVVPKLEHQRQAFLKEPELIGHSFENIAEFAVEDVQRGKGIKPVAVYQKTKLSEIVIKPLRIALNDFYNYDSHSGVMPEDHQVNILLSSLLYEKTKQLADAEDAYFSNHERVHLRDVLSEEAWQEYIQMNRSGKNPFLQNWYLAISIEMQKIHDGRVRVSVKLCNKSKYQENDRAGSRAKRETERVNDLFNAKLSIDIEGAFPLRFPMPYFRDDYKYDTDQYAIGSGCSVLLSDDHLHMETSLLPVYEQYRLKTRPGSEVAFTDLINKPVVTLKHIYDRMLQTRDKWEADYSQKKASGELTEKGQQQFQAEIDAFTLEVNRFKAGVDLIEREWIAKQAFIFMNEAFQSSNKKYSGWRRFQIVFIVSLLPDIVACDPDIMTDSEKKKTHLKDVDLLFFPTGGGKTEAFLGIMVFNLFFDRMRSKQVGVTAVLKYPLRLLSVQQVQRVADILACAEKIRKEHLDIASGDPFAVGYFVGDVNTPNSITPQLKEKLLGLSRVQMDEQYRVVDRCPFCGRKTTHVRFDANTNHLVHYCDNNNCSSGGQLPIYIVDTDIYSYLPSVIISTIDKMAAVGNNRRFKNILGSVAQKCPVHGYHELGRCEKSDCSEPQIDVQLYDAAPTLFIQDELHLVRESLGTYDSHYESLIQYMIANLSDSHRPAKIISATATISSYENQIQNLYNKKAIRFPSESPYIKENFYAQVDEGDLHRLILGYTPYGRAIINSVVYSMKAMRVCVNRYREHPELVIQIPDIGLTDLEAAKKVVEDYWIMLEYNNVRVDGNNVLNALDAPINVELRDEDVPIFQPRKMTGDDTFQDVRQTLAEVENTKDAFESPFNLIVATSMISHGVDADRFNNMMFFGIPGNMAEYIQAYSRVGRKFAGLVIDIIRPSRERELSWQKNFIKTHEFKDIMVDPVPINRWASRAIEQTLPGLFSALVLNHYTYALRDKREKLYMMSGLKKALEQGWITRAEVKEHMYQIYGCGEGDFHYARGNQYRKQIDRMIDEIFDHIDNSEFPNTTYITSGFPYHYRVMNSLRDTDVDLGIELK